MPEQKHIKRLEKEVEELRLQLQEATDMLDAIRTGQIDALIVQKADGHELYTLQSADRSYRIFIEQMSEGAITLNHEGIVLYANSRFAEMVAREISGVIGIKLRDFISAEQVNMYDEIFSLCKTEDCKAETFLMSPGRTDIPVQLSFAALETAEGKNVSVIVTDLSIQKKAQTALEENNLALEGSNRDLLRFASVASHDLQEPVRKIQIFSGLLKENEQDHIGDESKKYLGKIISSAARMKALIVDMLDYSRLNDNEPVLAPVDLNTVLQEVREDLELSITEHQVLILADELPRVNVNKSQMRQVFQNIISNSIKFSRRNISPVIRITVKKIRGHSFTAESDPQGDHFLFSFTDNGIGFDEQYAVNIFELFERLNTKDAYEGTGIGLAIAKKIVEYHKGLITAKGKENEGAEFLIILPAG